MLATNCNIYGTVADNSRIGFSSLDPLVDWNLFFDGSNDDAQVFTTCNPVGCDDVERGSLVGYTSVMED